MKLLTTLFFSFFCLISYGQETTVNVEIQNAEFYKKNFIYATYGNLIFVDHVSFSFERSFYQKYRTRFNAKLSVGRFPRNGFDLETGEKINKKYLAFSGVFCLNLFEVQLGVAYREYQLAVGFTPDPGIDYNENLSGLQSTGAIGFRFEKQNFILRAGVGNHELLYASIGVGF